MKELIARIAALFQRRSLERDLEDELRSHLEMSIELNIRQGMNPEEARRAAHLGLGGVEQIKETYRDQRGVPMIENALRDLRYAWRILLRSPGFTVVAVLSLALGIGANTAIFSLIYALMLRSLPVPNPQKLMEVSIVVNGKGSDSFSLSRHPSPCGSHGCFREPWRIQRKFLQRRAGK